MGTGPGVLAATEGRKGRGEVTGGCSGLLVHLHPFPNQHTQRGACVEGREWGWGPIMHMLWSNDQRLCVCAQREKKAGYVCEKAPKKQVWALFLSKRLQSP